MNDGTPKIDHELDAPIINNPKLVIPDGWECVGYKTPIRGMGYLSARHLGAFEVAESNFDESNFDHVRLCFRKVEPVDTELEEAKKLIGKWVKNDRAHGAIFVTHVFRDYNGDIIYSNGSSSASAKYWKPFPIPTWRCCEADRPKKEGYYFLRNKTTKEGDYVFFDRHYRKSMIWHNYEWLDEGEL